MININNQVISDECCLYLHSCQFQGIKSSTKGGSIYIFVNNNSPIGDNHIENCTFLDNESPEGGSIYVESHESQRFLNIDNCTFINNIATTKGGSICFYSTYCTINNSIFKNNYAASKGHEIYYEIFEHGDTEYPLLLDNNKFISNEENENQIKTIIQNKIEELNNKVNNLMNNTNSNSHMNCQILGIMDSNGESIEMLSNSAALDEAQNNGRTLALGCNF